MTDATSRLREARKQMQIVGEEIEDEKLAEEIEEAEAIIEGVEGALADVRGDV